MNLVEMLEPTEGEDCQWLGVYVTRWQREWGEPSVMFRDVDAAAIASVPEVKALVDAATALIDAAREVLYVGLDWRIVEFVHDDPTFEALKVALAALTPALACGASEVPE